MATGDGSIEPTKKSTTWYAIRALNEIVDSGALKNLGALELRIVMLHLRGADNKTGAAKVGGGDQIAEKVCHRDSRSRVLAAIKSLTEKGFLETLDPGGGRNHAATRRVVCPKTGVKPAPVSVTKKGGQTASQTGVVLSGNRGQTGAETGVATAPLSISSSTKISITTTKSDGGGADDGVSEEEKRRQETVVSLLVSIDVTSANSHAKKWKASALDLALVILAKHRDANVRNLPAVIVPMLSMGDYQSSPDAPVRDEDVVDLTNCGLIESIGKFSFAGFYAKRNSTTFSIYKLPRPKDIDEEKAFQQSAANQFKHSWIALKREIPKGWVANVKRQKAPPKPRHSIQLPDETGFVRTPVTPTDICVAEGLPLTEANLAMVRANRTKDLGHRHSILDDDMPPEPE